ncbi:MAG TPA: hypothetical protein PK922_14520, partial [Syntrophorhabdus sp.]|nr:hypothetical protein [Syntrophorhabdus sp.]
GLVIIHFSFYKPYFYIKATANDRICNLESLSYLASLHRYLTTRQISITDRHRETTFVIITGRYPMTIPWIPITYISE